jgi:hypothetical protein
MKVSESKVFRREVAKTFSYGVLFGGVDPLPFAWPQARRLFSVDRNNAQGSVPGRDVNPLVDFTNYQRVRWRSVLKPDVPLDVLVVRQPKDLNLRVEWERQFLDSPHRPKVIVVMERSGDLLQHEGQLQRGITKRIRSRGYEATVKYLRAQDCGSPMWSASFITVYTRKDLKATELDHWTAELGDDLGPRACSNCLMPTGVPWKAWVRSPLNSTIPPGAPSNVVGQTQGRLVLDPGGPMTACVESYVQTERGIRSVQPEEWLKMKGLPTTWTPKSKETLTGIVEAAGVHEWATIGDFILPAIHRHVAVSMTPHLHNRRAGPPMTSGPEPIDSWNWTAPDLSEGSAFYHDRVTSLKQAIAKCEGPEEWLTEGLETLKYHRMNYGIDGPQRLVVLWWEWPPEHWLELREGSSMNFLAVPPPILVANANMTPEELACAVSFLDELISLGVLELAARELLNTCPLFIVAKPGQPGQYRCIADMKRGHQNDCCVSDPVHLTCPDDILPRMYPGGFSAVVDASKFFHMFLTQDAERQFMGMIHPLTGVHYWYSRFPMGSRNSPGASGRFGAALLRVIQDTSEDFQGHPAQNDFVSYIRERGYNPSLGTGRVLMGVDGEPSLLIWIHVDDIFLHGPTYEKVKRGLDHIMNVALRLGLICQPVKTKPPAQRQRFCGFDYDSASLPFIGIPTDKLSRAKALLRFLTDEMEGPLARLSLSVVTGVLESLVPATPNRIGATFLRGLYRAVHRDVSPEKQGKTEAYYEEVFLDKDAKADLWWWQKALEIGLEHRYQVLDESTLGITWGDGSGTGSGGTVEFERLHLGAGYTPDIEAWMGTWDGRATSTKDPRSSNWKELRTLVEVLRRESTEISRFRLRRLLYFTDNMVTYHIARKCASSSPGLHDLIRELKILELQHSCQVLVVHVPGTTMIAQGTDGQSRGVWASPLTTNPTFKTADLFRPAILCNELVEWANTQVAPFCVDWQFRTENDSWDLGSLIKQHTFWVVPPSMARQAMSTALMAWVESPLDSSHLFVVPRILQREFGRVNKHIRYIGQFHDLPPASLPSSPLVPFSLFYLAPFVRSLETSPVHDESGLDLSSNTSAPWWVYQQVSRMRGLR